MKFDKIVGNFSDSVDPGAYLAKELEQGLEPIVKRVERLEKKIDILVLLLRSIDESLKKLQPLYDFLLKFPLFKK